MGANPHDILQVFSDILKFKRNSCSLFFSSLFLFIFQNCTNILHFRSRYEFFQETCKSIFNFYQSISKKIFHSECRPVPEEDAATSPKSGSSSQGNSRKGKGKSTKISSKRKEDSLWLEGAIPLQHCPLAPYLSPTLPPSVTITDASLDGLCLLRLLHALNRHWGILFPHLKSMSLLSPQDFINNKIAAKASRQLQDPLVIMTGNLPSWLQQIASVW